MRTFIVTLIWVSLLVLFIEIASNSPAIVLERKWIPVIGITEVILTFVFGYLLMSAYTGYWKYDGDILVPYFFIGLIGTVLSGIFIVAYVLIKQSILS